MKNKLGLYVLKQKDFSFKVNVFLSYTAQILIKAYLLLKCLHQKMQAFCMLSLL